MSTTIIMKLMKTSLTGFLAWTNEVQKFDRVVANSSATSRAPMKASDIKTLVRHRLWIEKRSYDVAEDVVVRCDKEEGRKRRK
jgi:hypothetical protein